MLKYADINLGENVNLPIDFITDIDFFVGIRKYGKSYAVGVLEEELLKQNYPFIVIDPMGIHHSLRETYNNIVVLGISHADYPLTDKTIDIVLRNRINTVFDLSDFDDATQRAVCTYILERVKENNREPLKIIIEESDIFIPQRGGDKECKAVITWLVRKGRQNGIGMTMICQRFASVDKEVLTQTDNYFVFRMNSPSDVIVLRKFIPKEDVKEIEKLTPGQCYINSGYFSGFFKVKKRLTEHQGVTPKLGVTRQEIQPVPVSDYIRDALETKKSWRDWFG